MIYALRHALGRQHGVDGRGPVFPLSVGQGGLLGPLAGNRVQRHGFLSQTAIRVNTARTEQNVRVMIALISAFARFVDGHVCGHAVALGQMAGKAMRQFLPLFGGKFGGKGNLHLSARDGVSALVVGLDPIPELRPVGCLFARKAERRKCDALAARVVVDGPGQSVFNPNPCTIGSASGGRMSSLTRVSLSSEVINRQTSLRTQPIGGRAVGLACVARRGVGGEAPDRT